MGGILLGLIGLGLLGVGGLQCEMNRSDAASKGNSTYIDAHGAWRNTKDGSLHKPDIYDYSLYEEMKRKAGVKF